MRIINFSLAFIVTILFFYLLIVGKDLIVPLVLALILWYLINTLALGFRKIKIFKWHLPLSISYILSITAITSIIYFFVNLISNNISDVIVLAPSYQKKLIGLVGKAYNMFGYNEPPTIRSLFRSVDIGSLLSQFALAITNIISRTGIIIIYLLFLFLEQKSFKYKLTALINNEKKRSDAFKILEKIDSDIRVYIGIKTFVSALTAILGYIIMVSQNLDFAEFWALLIFMLNFIPTIGSIIATLLPTFFALIQYDSVYPIAIIGVGIFILQFLIGNILEPRLMGNNLNLSPLVILLSLGLWGALWGISGMILCVPITVMVLIVLSHFPHTKPIAIILSKDGNVNIS